MSFVRVLVLATLIACSIAQQCTPGGQVDSYQTGMCNCWSGYAPSTTQGTDCKAHPKCAPAMPEDVDSVHSLAPKRPKTSFAYDFLEITQQVPIVANRKATWIQFVVPTGLASAGSYGAKTCQYPGPLWNKTVNGRDCIDEYRASVPWTQNGLCGFAKDTTKSTNSTAVFSSVLFTSTNETYTTGSHTYTRLSTTSYLISVSFVTQKTFSSGTFSVEMVDPTAVGVLTKYVVSDSSYDPISGATIIEIVTTALWPYSLAVNSTSLGNAFMSVNPTIPNIVVAFAANNDGSLQCDGTARSSCSQKWKVTISSSGACIDNIKGTYHFLGYVRCRDTTAGTCPAGINTVPFTINVHDTQLCDATPVDTASANSFTLTPFSDSDHTISSVQFQSGEKVFWTFEIVNPLVSIKSVTFNSIQLAQVQAGGVTGTPDILFNSAAGGVSSTGNNVNLQTDSASGVILAGSKGTLSFSFDLLRGRLPNTVGALQANNLEVQIATSVVVDIQYYGNAKRSVAMDLGSLDSLSAGSDTKSIRVVAADLMSDNADNQVSEVESSASLVHASLFVVFALFALLF